MLSARWFHRHKHRHREEKHGCPDSTFGVSLLSSDSYHQPASIISIVGKMADNGTLLPDSTQDHHLVGCVFGTPEKCIEKAGGNFNTRSRCFSRHALYPSICHCRPPDRLRDQLRPLTYHLSRAYLVRLSAKDNRAVTGSNSIPPTTASTPLSPCL